ncbi:hypothetical protein PUMCH_001929 [Australozyma saopauloensis]|uniref:Trehalase n=1 Tax=Australozyma saopauloensis TaxID=291208 RepID=A0AAX4H829_9ASCO|nr:hypothetical protein PUMCH_001929 [[Candida] saopauloensis]
MAAINHTRKRSEDIDPFDTAENYYHAKTDPARATNTSRSGRVRTLSMAESKASKAGFLAVLESYESASGTTTPDLTSSNEASEGYPMDLTTENIPKKPNHYHVRRASLDDSWTVPKRFLIKDINTTLDELLLNEDTDHNCQITIEDLGPKTLLLGTANSNGFNHTAVRGTYMLSNLLQELTIAKRFGRTQMILDESRLCENPVSRMKRLINSMFWPSLTRQITKENIVEMAKDTKIVEEYEDENGNIVKRHESVRLYIPYNRPEQFKFYNSIKEEHPDVELDVQYLPEKIDAEFIKSINKRPGLLALETQRDPKDPTNLINEPYVVPGGRFNELYGWDSYMIVLGLLLNVTPENQTNLKLSRGMTENFIYEINHYNKILNANRSYYLGRSQPPFLTDMALKTFHKTLEVSPDSTEDATDFLKRSILAAIREYNIVWCCSPRLDPDTGLSCYHPEGVGIPPETEASHFDAILKEYVEKYNITQEEFIQKYNDREIVEPDLDEYFLHDRAVRESGHDTTYRLEGKAAYLATVDLNALLYKYEIDIAETIRDYFEDALLNPETGKIESSKEWFEKAKQRQTNITKYLWNEEDSIFYDYHVKEKKQHDYESATCFWPLWSKVATEEQADLLVRNSLPKFEEYGGLVSGTLRLRGEVGIHRPSRQWDYPFGWAPQQILAWIGLANYNYNGAARRLVYRWLHMMTRAFVDYNGVVVEKYNVLKGAVPHKVDAEYGNQGADFKGVATEGFGWVNSSFLFGLTFLNLQAQRSIGALIPPETFLKNLNESQRDLYS